MIPQVSVLFGGRRSTLITTTTRSHPSFKNNPYRRSDIVLLLAGTPQDLQSKTFSHDTIIASSSSSFVSISDAFTSVPTSKEFEPVVDWTALGTFVSIMLVFVLLVRRTIAVERAVVEREAALEVVRELKSKALEAPPAVVVVGDGSSSSASYTTGSNRTTGSLELALERYETAVIQEERLRNIIPGVVRIVPPSASAAGNTKVEENARLAAKQFLGKDYDIGIPQTTNEQNPSGTLPFIALAILAVLGVSLTGLLIVLSMDPTTTASLIQNL